MPETPEEYFAERGFVLTFSRPSEDELEALYIRDGYLSRAEFRSLRKSEAVGPVVADLHATSDPESVLRAYGTGATNAEAALRAMRRWTSEQGD